VQGWALDFVPKLLDDARELIDAVVPVSSAEGIRLARELARREGVFVGISAGATLAGALRIAAQAPEGASILCMLPDTGERYLSTPLFGDVLPDMNEDEKAVFMSVPELANYVPPAPPAPPPQK
jgi:cysteine synthase A